MTDGIIQEVLNNYYDDHFYNKKIGKRFNEVLDELKQELIEKIKQNPIVDYNNRCGCFGCKFIDYMIGDNQE